MGALAGWLWPCARLLDSVGLAQADQGGSIRLWQWKLVPSAHWETGSATILDHAVCVTYEACILKALEDQRRSESRGERLAYLQQRRTVHPSIPTSSDLALHPVQVTDCPESMQRTCNSRGTWDRLQHLLLPLREL
eukprot:870933-Rhodomonas_salina.2